MAPPHRRQTPNKERIWRLFRDRHLLSATTAAKLLPEISFSTIYRNLEKFVIDGKLTSFSHDGVTYYERPHQENHHHFACSECKKVFPIKIELQKLINNLPAGAVSEGIHLWVDGKCKECRQ